MIREILQIGHETPLKVIDIRQAREDDLAGVKALLKANHVDNLTEEQKADGFVTTNMTDEQMKTLSGIEGGITIAADGEKVVAFALAAPWDFWEQWPFFVNMIGELPKYEYAGQRLSKENTYQYGPVCVDRAYRGQGIFENVFDLSLQGMSDRFPVMTTFVNHKNPRSHAAHTRKAGMDVIGDFGYNGNTYYLLACETTAGCIHTK
ncbi:MAG: GNAT family acetyltransferase [Lachnospiraceae bacterium]|nr:GNAT family acetyltransferase [Lachnospiraceae bacterium]